MAKGDSQKTLGLKNSLGPELFSHPRDVVRVKELLYLSGNYPRQPSNPHPDAELYHGIKSFQEKNGLKPDATIVPGGPTDVMMAARSPTFRCIVCGGPHGGLYGAYCSDCGIKAGVPPLY